MGETENKQADETERGHWVREPTESFHGLRVINHNGTAFIEQVDNDGETRQSIMISDSDDLDDLIQALTEVSNSHDE